MDGLAFVEIASCGGHLRDDRFPALAASPRHAASSRGIRYGSRSPLARAGSRRPRAHRGRIPAARRCRRSSSSRPEMTRRISCAAADRSPAAFRLAPALPGSSPRSVRHRQRFFLIVRDEQKRRRRCGAASPSTRRAPACEAAGRARDSGSSSSNTSGASTRIAPAPRVDALLRRARTASAILSLPAAPARELSHARSIPPSALCGAARIRRCRERSDAETARSSERRC